MRKTALLLLALLFALRAPAAEPLRRDINFSRFTGLRAGKPAALAEADRGNLALNKPASSSSVENEEHSAAQANDGDPETCWRADDEPEGEPEWWQVDLERPFDLSGCQIRWPFDGHTYRYKVEGSADRKNWSLLSDQTNTTSTSQVHDLKFQKAEQVRYVKITVTGLDEGCWVSICEVKIFGLERTTGARK
jgi:hypothetical protein